MQRRTVLTGVVSTLTALSVAGCSSEGEGDTANGDADSTTDSATGGATDTEAPDTTEKPAIRIVGHEMSFGDFGAKVKGTVETGPAPDGSTHSYIQVKARFYDNNDTRVGEGMWNATDVKQNQTVAFETTTAMMDEKPASYEVEASTSP